MGSNQEFHKTKELKSGLGSTKIELVELNGKSVVLKHFKTLNKLKKELELYQMLQNEDFIPNIVYHDEVKKILAIEYCGESLDLKFKPKFRYVFKNDIRCIVKYLSETHNIYHNDIRWKNICIKDSQLFLIDWERWSTENKERDPEYILRDKTPPILHNFW